MILAIHIIAGSVALLAGFIAVFAAKGKWWHRKSGVAFAVSMIVMAVLAMPLALREPSMISVLNASLTFYFVATSYASVSRSLAPSPTMHYGSVIMGVAVTTLGVALSMRALDQPSGRLEGVPSVVWLVFTAVAAGALWGDVRVLRRGARTGASRLIRHLWRMEFALAIACLAFFIGQAKFFPEAVRIPILLAAPLLFVLIHLLYWCAKLILQQARGRANARPRPVREGAAS